MAIEALISGLEHFPSSVRLQLRIAAFVKGDRELLGSDLALSIGGSVKSAVEVLPPR